MNNNTAMKVITLEKLLTNYEHYTRSFMGLVKEDLNNTAIVSFKKAVHTFIFTLNQVKKYKFLIILQEKIDFHNQSNKLFICASISFLQVRHHNGPPY